MNLSLMEFSLLPCGLKHKPFFIHRYLQTITNVFFDQNRVNVCEHAVKTAPYDVCSHIFILL